MLKDALKVRRCVFVYVGCVGPERSNSRYTSNWEASEIRSGQGPVGRKSSGEGYWRWRRWRWRREGGRCAKLQDWP